MVISTEKITPGDLVKITIKDFKKPPQVIVGMILEASTEMPHLTPNSPEIPGPVTALKVLLTSGKIWDSWVDRRDEIEVFC